ncbi:MAG: class I SAM-dependent methyltransferase [bacterium]
MLGIIYNIHRGLQLGLLIYFYLRISTEPKVLSKIKFTHMDAQSMKFRDDSFNTVISANFLHDVKKPKKSVQEMIRITRPGGKIIISDLNKKGMLLVNKVYRKQGDVHKGSTLDLEKISGEDFKKAGIYFKKYNDGYITTYVCKKAGIPDPHCWKEEMEK